MPATVCQYGEDPELQYRALKSLEEYNSLKDFGCSIWKSIHVMGRVTFESDFLVTSTMQ